MTEESLQKQISNYIKWKYPKVVFTAESSGIRVPIRTAKKMKAQRSGRGLPDLMILEPRGAFAGLMIELKKDTPFTKAGKLKSDRHLHEQNAILLKLGGRGYRATWGIGFDRTVQIIDEYMNLPANYE